MKRLLLIFAFCAIGMSLTAQILAPAVVKEDKVITYNLTDTLEAAGDSVVEYTWYGKDFFETVRLQVNADSFAAGYTKIEITAETSLDNSNWTAHADTINLAANGADSDVNIFSTLYWDYFKVKLRGVDSTQSSNVDFNILFDVNQ